MQTQRIQLSANHYTWLVLDEAFEPVKPIASYLTYLTNTEKSPNTLQSYANHLRLYWEFLTAHEYCWKSINLKTLAQFINWLRYDRVNVIALDPHCTKRQANTINSILAAINSFYRYHKQLGATDITLTEQSGWRSGSYKGLLYHIYKGKPQQKRLIKLKYSQPLPKYLSHEQVKALLNATSHPRDYFLIHLLYETGLRMGQALRLRHVDIKSWDNEILIQPGEQWLHERQNKSHEFNVIHVSPSLMRSYANFLSVFEEEFEHDFVFVNLQTLKPLNYTAIRKLFLRLTKATGIKVTPHMLRHTHATELLRSGWEPAFVQKRLGHKHLQTTLDIYSHISNEDLKAAYKAYLQQRGDF